MGRKRRIFTVRTPLGYRVFLDRDRWRTITKRKHPALAKREQDVRACLLNPELVRSSATEPDVHLYYVSKGSNHLCVVVAPTEDGEYFIVTAYDTVNIKKGTELWKS